MNHVSNRGPRGRGALLVGMVVFAVGAWAYRALSRDRSTVGVHPAEALSSTTRRAGRLRAGQELEAHRLSSNTPAPHTAPVGTPEERGHPIATLTESLTRYPATIQSDLSTWQAVDWATRGLATHYMDRAGIGPEDAHHFETMLESSRSIGMQQYLLVSLGVLGPPDPDRLAPYLTEPGLGAACAFALGRNGSSRAIAILMEELDRTHSSHTTRESLYFGLAQAGPTVLPQLIAASESWLLAGIEPGRPLPVSFLRSPASRGPLRALASGHADPALRAMAIRGFVATHGPLDADPSESDWLAHLVSQEHQDLQVRIEALNGLSELKTEDGGEVVATLLEQPGLSTELLDAALGLASSVGIPDEHVELVLELALSSPSEELRGHALSALAKAGGAEVDARLAQLLSGLERHERARLLGELFERSVQARASGEAPGLSPALVDALSELLGDPHLDPHDRSHALGILGDRGDDSKALEASVWQRYLSAEDQDRRRALVEAAGILGADVNDELMSSYRSSDELVGRIELAITLAQVPDNVDRPEVAQFLKEEVLPSLRSDLPNNTGLPLAYLGSGNLASHDLAALGAAVFGRYGDRSDIELLEGLGDAFLENQSHWPTKLKLTVHAALTEAAAQGADLIRLRLLAE